MGITQVSMSPEKKHVQKKNSSVMTLKNILLVHISSKKEPSCITYEKKWLLIISYTPKRVTKSTNYITLERRMP